MVLVLDMEIDWLYTSDMALTNAQKSEARKIEMNRIAQSLGVTGCDTWRRLETAIKQAAERGETIVLILGDSRHEIAAVSDPGLAA